MSAKVNYLPEFRNKNIDQFSVYSNEEIIWYPFIIFITNPKISFVTYERANIDVYNRITAMDLLFIYEVCLDYLSLLVFKTKLFLGGKDNSPVIK